MTPILLQNRQEMAEIQWWKPKHLASQLARDDFLALSLAMNHSEAQLFRPMGIEGVICTCYFCVFLLVAFFVN